MHDSGNAIEEARRLWVGRAWIVGAALLWSSSGLFAKATIFHDWPAETRGLHLAFWRALFATVVLLPAARGIRWRPLLPVMALAFAGMNATFLSAMSQTTAANAIWLQCTAPFWIVLLGPMVARESFDSRNVVPLVLGALGIGLILTCELRRAPTGGGTSWGIWLGLAAGVFYATVAMCLRALRGENPAWLVALNHAVSAAVLAPMVLGRADWPTPAQFAVLAGFGVVQMAVPYVMFARGLRLVPSQEATLIALCEPVLLPVWVWLAWGEVPAWWTVVGGGLILLGLVLRYATRLNKRS